MQIFKKKRPLDYIIYSAVIIVGIIIDQVSKFIVSRNMSQFESIPLIEDFLHITYITNDGASFGMMDGPAGRMVFMIVSTVAIILFTAYLYLGHADNLLYGISLSMVISGGIGNMIDRLGFGFYVSPDGVGEVIDFIDFCGIWNAIFNGADSFVCVGSGLLILALVMDIIKETKAERAKKSGIILVKQSESGVEETEESNSEQ